MKIHKKIIIFSFFILFCSCKENVVKLKSEHDANKVLLGLRESHIDAQKEFEASEWVIKVPQSSFTDALRVMQTKRLFEKVNFSKNSEKTNDIFASKDQKNKEYLQNIAQEISTSLNMFQGVLDSRVHLFKDVESPESRSSSSGASVLLLTESNVYIPIDTVKLLVSKASGLSHDAVVVIQNTVEKKEQVTHELINESLVNADQKLLEQTESKIAEIKVTGVQKFGGLFAEYGSILKKTLGVFTLCTIMIVLVIYFYHRYRRRKEFKMLQALGV